VVAGRVRELLTADGLRHEDLAAGMRSLGFRWRANHVAQVVTGRRALSLLEIAGVCEVLRRPLAELLADAEAADPKITLPHSEHDAVRVPLAFIRAALTGGAGQWAAYGEGYAAEVEAIHEATGKAARRLGRTPTEVSVASAELWGRPLTHERDARLNDDAADGDEDPRRRQARRGHITRALIEELRAHFEQREGSRR
jgi:transcriptional regulator with XRE-family HTH domain